MKKHIPEDPGHAWLAGWVEGEGYFSAIRGTIGSAVISVSSEDKDSVMLAKRLVPGSRVNGPYLRNSKAGVPMKPAYVWRCSGMRAIPLLWVLRGSLGRRRTEKVDSMFRTFDKHAAETLKPAEEYLTTCFAETRLGDLASATRVRALFWLAGFLEGEGSFFCNKQKSLRVSAASTDKDVIKYLAWIVDDGRLTGPYQPSYPGSKQMWYWHAQGQEAADLMRLLRPLMSLRRKKQITAALRSWDGRGRKLVKLSAEQVKGIRRELRKGTRTAREIAETYGTERYSVYNIKYGYCHKQQESN